MQTSRLAGKHNRKLSLRKMRHKAFRKLEGKKEIQNCQSKLHMLANFVEHMPCLRSIHQFDASVNAATPGKFLPSKSSKEAPPPVLQCVTLSSVPYFLHAVAVSPPPIMVMVPAAVAATTASINVFVPASNF